MNNDVYKIEVPLFDITYRNRANRINKLDENDFLLLVKDKNNIENPKPEDIKSISFQMVYSFKKFYKISDALEKSAVINVEPHYFYE